MDEEQHPVINTDATASLRVETARPKLLASFPSSLKHISLHTFVPRIETFRWVGGIYFLILGMAFLLLPQGKIGVWLQPIWLVGGWMLLTGMGLLWLNVLTLSRRLALGLSIVMAIPLFIVCGAYLLLAAVAPAIILGLFILGILFSPLVPPGEIDSVSRPDALGLIFGAGAAAQGLDFLLRSSAATAIPVNLRISPIVIALVFVVSGCAVIITQLISKTPNVLRWLAHLACGLVVIGLQAAIAVFIDPVYWVLGAATCLRGFATIFLPWWSQRAARFDRSAFRPRIALALTTASLVPVMIALPVVLVAFPQNSAAYTMEREVAYGTALLLMILSGIGGWWLAGTLTTPLTSLMHGVDRITEGRHTMPLPQQGTSELVRLSQAVEQMARALDERAQEQAMLTEQLAAQNMELMEAERERAQALEAFQTLADHAPDVITRHDVATFRYLYANPAIERATGIPAQAFVGKTYREVGLAENLCCFFDQSLEQVVTSKQPTHVTYLDRGRHYQSLLVPEENMEHQFSSILVISHDITALQQAHQQTEEALQALISVAQALVLNRESLKRDAMGYEHNERAILLRHLLEVIYSTLSFAGAVMVVLVPETQMVDLLLTSGFPLEVERGLVESIQGIPLSQLFGDPTIPARLYSGEIVIIDRSHPYYQQGHSLTESGLTMFVPMRLGETLIGILALYAQESQEHFSDEQQALAEAIGSLAALLIERERLSVTREEAFSRELAAKEAAQQMDAFLGIVSHELKTPITVIKGNLQLAARKLQLLRTQGVATTEDDMKSVMMTLTLLDRSQRQLGMQTRLVNDLIDVSRIQTNSLELQLELQDLVHLVQEVVEDQSMLTSTRQITFYTSEQEVPVLADGGRVGQVITNYLTNALKYSESSQPVEVNLGLEGAMARVAVRDYGPGLTLEQQQHIWERFHRVPGISVRSGSGIGLGLGLYICKQLIERQGGQVGTESTPGQGSTFWFTLPRVQS